MSHRLFASLLIVFLLGAPLSHSSVESTELSICNDLQLLLEVPLPLGYINSLCSVHDSGNPVQHPGPSQEDDEATAPAPIEENDVPEETKQQALLVLLVWSQT